MKRFVMPGSRQEKSFARAFQTDVAGPKKQMLMFPGWDYRSGEGARCLHASRSMDLIDRRTRFLCVERAEIYVPPIREQIEALGLTSRTRLHHGELSDLVLEPHERFDFAYFDFDHILDHRTAFWIADQFCNQVVEDCDVSFTAPLYDRASVLLKECHLAFQKKFRREMKRVRDFLGIDDPKVLAHALILITIFRNFEFNFHPVYAYRPDHRSMLAFKFTNLRSLNGLNDWPSIQEVVEVGQALHAEQILRQEAAAAARAARRREQQAA